MTIKELSRGQKLLERIGKLNALEDKLKFLRQSNRPLWLHAGDSHAEVMQIQPGLGGAVLDILDKYVEREKKKAEEEFEKL